MIIFIVIIMHQRMSCMSAKMTLMYTICQYLLNLWSWIVGPFHSPLVEDHAGVLCRVCRGSLNAAES